MKITNNNYKTNTSFNSNAQLKALTKIIPNTKVCKNLTELDCRAAKTYVFARRFALRTTPEEVSSLFKNEGEEFFTKTLEFLSQKIGLKESFYPGVISSDFNNLVPFFYLPKNNSIVRPEDISGYSKNDIFSLLRHELQHHLQHMTILRDSELGDAIVNYNVEMEVETYKKIFLDALRSKPFETVVKDFALDAEGEKFMSALKKADIEKDDNAINKLFEPMRQSVKQQWDDYRKEIISEYGVLPENRKEDALSYFQDFTNIDYYNPDGSLNIVKHSLCKIECDANVVAQHALFEINNGGCFFKHLKQTTLDLLNSENSELAKFREDLFEEMENKLK